MGYLVRSAEDGLSALHEIRQESPDILLTDLNMPGTSGFELLTEVRSLFPAIKVIATSGAFCGSEIPPGVLADAFYQKGSSVSMLLQILRALPHMKCRSLEHPVNVHPSPFGGMQGSLSMTGA
jgi:CheY-like chemotaxis protein